MTRRIKSHWTLLPIVAGLLLVSGCSGIIKERDKGRPLLLRTETASIEDLKKSVTHLSAVNSIRAKMDLRFEDNSFAELGISEKYRSADGEVIVQRPANIFLKIQAPIAVTSLDIAQMASDGERFSVAILNDGGSGKNRRFIIGTNKADYSALKKVVSADESGQDRELVEKVNAFAEVRPQHFTEAVLVRPISDENFTYVMSSVFVDEEDLTSPKKSPIRRVMRGYYLLDEISRDADGSKISRRFWFDRVGTVRLARQQIFDSKGEIDADIIYGLEGDVSSGETMMKLPLSIAVTRPKEKYMLRLSYQSPEFVTIGRTYDPEVFRLTNEKDLPVIDLDERLKSLQNNR